MKKILSTLCALSFLTVGTVSGGTTPDAAYQQKVEQIAQEESDKVSKLDDDLAKKIDDKNADIKNGVADELGGREVCEALNKAYYCLESSVAGMKTFEKLNESLLKESSNITKNSELTEATQEKGLLINLTAAIIAPQLAILIGKCEKLKKALGTVINVASANNKKQEKNLETLIQQASLVDSDTENELLKAEATVLQIKEIETTNKNDKNKKIKSLNEALKVSVDNIKDGFDKKKKQIGSFVKLCAVMRNAFKEIEELEIDGKEGKSKKKKTEAKFKNKIEQLKQKELSKQFDKLIYMAKLYGALLTYYYETDEKSKEELKNTLPDENNSTAATEDAQEEENNENNTRHEEMEQQEKEDNKMHNEENEEVRKESENENKEKEGEEVNEDENKDESKEQKEGEKKEEEKNEEEKIEKETTE